MNEATEIKEVKEEAPAKIVQNGITRPKVGTKTGRVFEIADGFSARDNAPAKRKDVLDACAAEELNKATAATQYGRWRKFNGLEKEVNAVAEVVPAGGATASDTQIEE